MDRALVDEPSVSAFLRSVRRKLSGHISQIDLFLLSNTSPEYYDPREDLEKLKEKLTSIQDLLVDGEARRLVAVDEWMDDIKDLLYDVEDILDEMMSLNNHQVRVHELFITSGELKDRLGVILARTEVLGIEAKDLELKRRSAYAFSGESKVTLRTPETSSVVDRSMMIYGRENDKDQIVERLLEVDAKQIKNYDVLCIVGMGGVGKTTLAQLVFNHPKIVEHFDVKSWVCISYVFDVARTTKELIENSGRAGGEHQSLGGLQRRLKKTVENKRFLFVLDDVWSSREWEIMTAPFSSCANGSKILVTTRMLKIAHDLGGRYSYELALLSEEQCEAIFRDMAFVDDEDDHEKLIFGRRIVRACGGLPIAVKVIGSMLQEVAVEKWRALSEAICANVDDEIHPAIKFGYYGLPAAVKRCFEYLALFPPDFKFEEDDVVRLWIADGLVEEMEGRMAEDIGAEYYNTLKARSLIENNMMHDIVHHLASLVSRKFCYNGYSNVPPASVRHAFVEGMDAIDNYKYLAQAPFLRTLIVKTANENFLGHMIRSCKMLRTLSISDSKLSFCMDHLKHIRYLTITGSDIRLLTDSLCKLDNLQVLNLSGSKNLKQVPKDIQTLRSLRVLDLSNTSVTNLPESICALSQLQVLNLQNCGSLKQLPKNIGHLRSLRKLWWD